MSAFVPIPRLTPSDRRAPLMPILLTIALNIMGSGLICIPIAIVYSTPSFKMTFTVTLKTYFIRSRAFTTTLTQRTAISALRIFICSVSSLLVPDCISKRSRTLPLTWTTSVTKSSATRFSSYYGQVLNGST